MYSFSYLEPFSCSMSSSVVAWPATHGKVVWYCHLFQNFLRFVVIHTVKGFGLVNKAKVDVFLELSCFFHDPADVGNLISGSSAFSKSSLYIWKFWVHVLLKPSLKDFEHNLASMWTECNCRVIWTFFGFAFPWNWIENCPFPVLWPLLGFPNLLTYWVQHFNLPHPALKWNTAWKPEAASPPRSFQR